MLPVKRLAAGICLWCICLSGFVLAQAPPTQAQTQRQTQTQSQPALPEMDIFLADFQQKDGKWIVGRPAKLTNRKGYDNQPFFLPDGKSMWFTSIREDDQADIYRIELSNRQITRVTETSESEFSPTIMPDGKHFSVVRVEADKTQRLWKFPLAGGAPELILETVKPVGYHCWIDANNLALFILGPDDDHNFLWLAELRNKKSRNIANNPGRSIRISPGGGKISFVEKKSKTDWWIVEFDLKTDKTVPLIRTLPESEDFIWLSDSSILMSHGSKLYRWNRQEGSEWKEIADLSSSGLRKITRIALSPDAQHIAIVAEP